MRAVGPRIPHDRQSTWFSICSRMEPWCLPLGRRHPFVPSIGGNKPPSSLECSTKHRLLLNGFSASIDGVLIGFAAPGWLESPSHWAKVSRDWVLAVDPCFGQHRQKFLRTDVPGRFERNEVRNRFTLKEVRKFAKGRGQGEATAHGLASNWIFHDLHQCVNVNFCTVDGNPQLIDGRCGRIKFTKTTDPGAVHHQFRTSAV